MSLSICRGNIQSYCSRSAQKVVENGSTLIHNNHVLKLPHSLPLMYYPAKRGVVSSRYNIKCSSIFKTNNLYFRISNIPFFSSSEVSLELNLIIHKNRIQNQKLLNCEGKLKHIRYNRNRLYILVLPCKLQCQSPEQTFGVFF